jgi:erlin
MHANIIFDE